MKGVVAYDSYYGNTKRVAEAIVEQIKADGHEAELRSVREKYPSPPQGDFLFLGSPNRFKKVTRKTKRFVKKLDRDAWKNKPIAIFVTVGQMPPETATEEEKAKARKWILEAGPQLRDIARARGFNVVEKVLHVPVKDSKGPLVDDGIELTKQYTHEFVEILKK